MLDEKLLEKAKSLGISTDGIDDESKLKGMIEEKEKESKKDDDKNKDPEYLAKELKKAIEKRDEAKQSTRKLSDKISELEGKLKDSPSSTEVAELKKELKELRDYRKETDDAREAKELESKSEVEKLQIQLRKTQEDKETNYVPKTEIEKFQKKMEEFETALNSERQEKEILRKSTLKGQIIEAAAKHSAASPSQIVKMTSGDFVYDKDTGKFLVYEKDAKGKITDYKDVDEYIKDFLGQDENANLVKSGAITDDLGIKGDRSDKSNKEKKEYGTYDPKDEKLIFRAGQVGLSVEDYIDTQILKDNKLKAIAEKRKGK